MKLLNLNFFIKKYLTHFSADWQSCIIHGLSIIYKKTYNTTTQKWFVDVRKVCDLGSGIAISVLLFRGLYVALRCEPNQTEWNWGRPHYLLSLITDPSLRLGLGGGTETEAETDPHRTSRLAGQMRLQFRR